MKNAWNNPEPEEQQALPLSDVVYRRGGLPPIPAGALMQQMLDEQGYVIVGSYRRRAQGDILAGFTRMLDSSGPIKAFDTRGVLLVIAHASWAEFDAQYKRYFGRAARKFAFPYYYRTVAE